MRRFPRSIARRSGGFSLLELSIVITIISIMAVMGLEMAAAFLSSTAYQNTQTTANTVDTALVKFRAVYGRLPCPAVLNLPVTDANYGKENCATSVAVPANAFDGTIGQLPGGIAYISVTNGGTAYGDGGTGSNSFALTIKNAANNATAAATAHLDTDNLDANGYGPIKYVTIDNPGYGYKAGDAISITTANSKQSDGATPTGSGAIFAWNISTISVGALPIRELNLPLADALDGFSGKFLYYVTTDLTSTASFANEEGVIQVRTGPLAEPCSGNCSVSVNGAAYAIISTGRDQRGAYSRRGAKKNDCVLDPAFLVAIDSQNCFFEGSSVAANLSVVTPLGVIYNSPFSNGINYSNYIDDIVVPRLKSDL